MRESPRPSYQALPFDLACAVDDACCRFEGAWKTAEIAGKRPCLDDYLNSMPDPGRIALLGELVALDIAYRRRGGEHPQAGDYEVWFGGLEPAQLPDMLAALQEESAPCEQDSKEAPPQVGRYRVVKVVGEGGYGRVYLAQDDQLNRPVAIKVPHGKLVSQAEDALAYLTEAQNVARLDHPNIVPVFDVGGTEQCRCFIVSKFIEGSTLAQRIEDDRPSFTAAAELVATVAEALHYAHGKGLVHRDIKPGNILLDAGGKPYIADFGLALKEEQLGQGPRYVGTPAYMSPEQARGEGHRVDGRSDIFSLGVVFYELLAGRRPFRGASKEELLEQITDLEPSPLRQMDERIPKELERICFKALSKRAAERYLTAKDMVEELRHFVSEQTVSQQAVPVGKGVPSPFATTVATPTSDIQPVKIVPKGLRSFDAHDAGFFLELLPGPRDREGLPSSIRFWKTRIEERDPDQTFSVGLIYGPSGCGKSSLVKAGLIPRLADQVLSIYIEATADETETRLLNGLRRGCPALADNLRLKETLAALRRGQGLAAGKKVLIVLDQFEQWLHAKREEQSTELVQALRQCDGGQVQCLALVRDDFWLAVSRFLRELEIRLVDGDNSALVDVFDLEHAQKVLAAFGRAFGKLPANRGETSKEQEQFLNQAVSDLAPEGKVICVQLTLFAEMMKGKPWTPASLKAVGGIEGVGVIFLEEAFSAATAPPEHRYHQKSARAVLRALLPGSGTDIKGHMRSQQELLETSGYGSRPADFEDLMRILDRSLRLITPTDPEGRQAEGDSASGAQRGTKYYQLTHDYLVKPLREWLTRKQKESRRGRAELRLAERAAAWNAKPERRHLPAWWEWANIRLFTRQRDWTPSQRHMMRSSARFHGVRAVALVVVLALLGWGGWDGYGRLQAYAFRDLLLNANTTDAPTIVNGMAPYRRWIDSLLRDAYNDARAKKDPRKQLHASLALLPVDSGQVDYLYQRLLDAEPHEVPIIREGLLPHKEGLLDKLWATVEQGQEQQRLRAACALAAYDPDGSRWARVQDQVTHDLVGVPVVYLAGWIDAFRPVRAHLLAPLAVVFRDANRRETERSLATYFLADYAADRLEFLAELVKDADFRQFAVLWPKLRQHRERAPALLSQELAKTPAPDASAATKDALALRQAQAAVVLLQLGQDELVWPLLRHSPDPRVRSFLIHRLGPLGTDSGILLQRLEKEREVSVRRALLLCLGELGESPLPVPQRQTLAATLLRTYHDDPDPGIHGATEWLLRRWGYAADLAKTDEELVSPQARAGRRWYINGQGQTMVVLPGPVEFMMGSPPTEARRQPNERLHRRRIGRTFAIATKPVTVEQFLRFRNGYAYVPHYAPTEDCAVPGVNWYQAAEYCNWLSAQEGLPAQEWCYQPIQDSKALLVVGASTVGLLGPSTNQGPFLAASALIPGRTDPPYAGRPLPDFEGGMKLAPDYLQRSGYRLPTEAEWEYACRAGAVTSRYYGDSEELLGKYAWYLSNSAGRSWPVGRLKPNDFGLFDMHGNVWTRCQDRFTDYAVAKDGKPFEDQEDSLSVNNEESRLFRGGSFDDRAGYVRSAFRNYTLPALRDHHAGFRPARTFR